MWAQTPSGPMPEALAALQSTADVEVVTNEWLIFKPANKAAENGLIIYPGGRVDPRSYAPSAAAIAQQGYLVVITPMPLNLAVFSPALALEVQQTFPEIKNWSIAGHSLGGAMAANLIRNNPQSFDGLILWASYPAENDNLSEVDIRTLSIHASLDGLTTPEKIEATRHLLPDSTTWVVIEGGNHAQFGWYGDQNGDNPAQIDRNQQQDIIVQATLAFLSEIQMEKITMMKKFTIIFTIIWLIVLLGPFLVPVPPLENTKPVESLADPDSLFLEVNDLKVHYKIYGQGEPVYILLHGFAASVFSWREVTQPLAETGTVIAFDRPAFGLTERPTKWSGDNPYSPDFQAKLVVGLMDKLKIMEAILVGNSAGGSVATLTSLTYPERVQVLILVDAAIYNGGGTPSWAAWLIQSPQMQHIGPLIARRISDSRRGFRPIKPGITLP